MLYARVASVDPALGDCPATAFVYKLNRDRGTGPQIKISACNGKSYPTLWDRNRSWRHPSRVRIWVRENAEQSYRKSAPGHPLERRGSGCVFLGRRAAACRKGTGHNPGRKLYAVPVDLTLSPDLI